MHGTSGDPDLVPNFPANTRNRYLSNKKPNRAAPLCLVPDLTISIDFTAPGTFAVNPRDPI